MKLAQKIALSYYRTKIRTQAIFSKQSAATTAFNLFCKPFNRAQVACPGIFSKAIQHSFVSNGLMLKAWEWIPDNFNGKTVLVAHGLNSCSYRFDKYIILLQKAGFKVVAFDAPAHGQSEGIYIHSLAYKQAILKADNLFGSFYAIVAHSLGALAASLAAEELTLLQKLVLIAPATESSRALDKFASVLHLSNNTMQAVHNHIYQINGQHISWYAVSRAVQQIKARVLWLHDKEDPICPFADVEPVMQQALPNIRFMVTEGQGHSNIYRHVDSVKAVMQFVKENEA